MDKEHTYHVTAWWSAGQTGIAKSDSAPSAIHFAAPAQFGGLEGRWSPEDLLLSAIASCFTTTFQAIAAHSSFGYTDLQVEVEGTVAKTRSGYCFTGIVIRPRLAITEAETENRALDLLQKTKALCLVSRAIGIAQEFLPVVEVSKLEPAHQF